MHDIVTTVGPRHSVSLFGVKLVGVNAENLTKLLITLALLLLLIVVGKLLKTIMRCLLGNRRDMRFAFWARQGVHVFLALVFLVGIASVWFDDPARLTTALGLVTAGLAFALQKVVTSLAGYFVILRGKTFNVGDRITMGGVRGDVIALGFLQTTIMEMGQPPEVQNADPAMWVKARQYSGRIVTVSNSKIFDDPVFNYSRDFPYLWEEIMIPISFEADRARTEQILMEAATDHAVPATELSERSSRELQRRYVIRTIDIAPKVFFRITSNWLELAVRFLVKDHEIREVKDAMSRQIMTALDEARIAIASTTFEIVGVPPIRIQHRRTVPDGKN